MNHRTASPDDELEDLFWEDEPPLLVDAGNLDAPRERHDAFTGARKAAFLNELLKTGCILDACRVTRVSARTVYRHQESDPRFADNCAAAIRMAATPIELTAWQRAVEGVEQEFACGGQVHVRRRYDAGLMRLLLQGSNPKKYGPRPGFKRKRMLRHERKQMEREVRAEIAARHEHGKASGEELTEAILRKLEVLDRRNQSKRLAAGWTRSADGEWIPPGFARVPGYAPPAGAADETGWEHPAPEPPGETM